MTEPIYDHLAAEAGQVGHDIADGMQAGEELAANLWHGITDRLKHHGYDDRNAASRVPEERAMAEGFDDDLKEYFSEGFTYVKNLATRMEAEAPRLISLATAAGSQTVSAAVEALAGRVLPPDIDAWLAGIVKDAIAKFGAPAPASAEQPAEAPAA
jgi:hypothetical protein